MIEKRVVLILLVVLVLLSVCFVVAQENGNDENEEVYDCLADKLGDNCGNTENSEQAAFNLLAMAWDRSINNDCQDSLMDKERDNCWPRTEGGGCNLKSTALAIIALNYAGKDTDDYVEWLLDRKKLSKDLEWYLEIDAENETRCEIKVDGRRGTTITISEDKTISGSNPSGLTKAYNDYWFKITNLERNFSISCDQNFITTLFYKRPGSSIFYISGNTHPAAAGDTTEEKVSSYCFSTGTRCDFEGSLWAALALQNSGKDTSPFLPYLTTLAEDSTNKRYFPSVFLYLLTNADDYYSTIVEKQKQNKYWKEGADKFYDTALALLALQGSGALEVDNAKEHLLDLFGSNCWGANTAFILYAGWKRDSIPTTSGNGDGPTYCTNFDHFCVASSDCTSDNQVDFYCPVFNDVCCKVEPHEESCLEKGGAECPSTQVCSGSQVPAADTPYCCIGDCEEPPPEDNECEEAGYICRESCSEYQIVDTTFSCDDERVCCINQEPPEPSGNWVWIVILVILIILVVLGIIFRDKLRKSLFKKKSRFKTGAGPGRTGRPSMPPPGFRGMPPRRRTMPPPRGRPMHRPMRRPTGKTEKDKDKDFEETMKKLREMSK
jgi:hypothetical protein